MKKKFLLSVMLMCISIFAFGMLNVSAETTGTYENLTYKIKNDEVTITDCDSSATEVKIPEEIEGKKVTSIGNSAFYDCSNLTSVTIGNNVKNIYSSAFENCNSLTSITIPENVTTIGEALFYNCTGLTKINWNAKNADFQYDSAWARNVFASAGTSGNGIEVVFADTVESIPSDLFHVGYSRISPKIVSVIIGKNVTDIGSYAFYDCSSLTNVTLGESLKSIGNYAFYGCKEISNVNISDLSAYLKCNYSDAYSNPMFYGKTLYLNGETIKGEVEIPHDVTKIPPCAFLWCNELTSITIGENVTAIDDYAFLECRNLTKINWNAKNIEDIACGDYIFGYAGANSDNLEVVFGDSVEHIPANLFEAYNDFGRWYYKVNITKVTLGKNIKSVGSGAFEDCDNLHFVYVNDLTSYLNCNFDGEYSNPMQYGIKFRLNGEPLKENLEIPKGVSQIANYAFYNCSNLTSITIPDSVTSIGYYAFYGCKSLTNITIPNSVTTISRYAFSCCSGLTSITIPNSVTSIGYYAFYGCKSLTNITIPDSITSIGDSAFGVCSSLTSITIPNSVTTIGDSAFSYCSSLTSVTIPNSVTSIGSSAFYSCSSLTDVIIPCSIKTISNSLFYYCYNLKQIVIPKEVIKIDICAFYYCNNLSEIYYGGSERDLEDVLICAENDALNDAKLKTICYVKLIDSDDKESFVTCLPNTKIKLSDIEKMYMHKVTLYTDKAMKTEFDTSTAISGNMTLYVKLGEEITVIYGDFDDDGKITMKDAIYLFNHAMLPNKFPLPAGQKTDYNNDGKFDMNDAIYLFNHTMLPNKFPI